jgi:fluoride exporter
MDKAGSRPLTRPLEARATHPESRRPPGLRIPWLTLGVIAVGGVAGALVRQGIWVLFPHRVGVFDWATLGINTVGCALIGALMTAITEVRHAHRLAGPFLGVGVLGGFTTFSTYIVEIQQSIKAGVPQIGLAYLAATLAAALLAVYAGTTATRLLSRWHRKERSRSWKERS